MSIRNREKECGFGIEIRSHLRKIIDPGLKLSNAMVKLSDLEPGQEAVVAELPHSGGAHFRLRELGLLPGTLVRFIRKAPFGGPLEVRIRNTNYSLRQTEASKIGVRLA